MTLLLERPTTVKQNPSRPGTQFDYNVGHLGIDGNNAVNRKVDNTHPNSGTVSVDNNFLLDMTNKEGIGTVSVEDKYGNVLKVSVITANEEVRRAVLMYKKAFVFFGTLSALNVAASAVFITLGLAGILSPVVSTFGALLSGALTFGVYLDFRKWEKRHA